MNNQTLHEPCRFSSLVCSSSHVCVILKSPLSPFPFITSIVRFHHHISYHTKASSLHPLSGLKHCCSPTIPHCHPDHLAHDHGVNFSTTLLCLFLLLFSYLLGLLVAAKHLGWVFWKPSIIWHVLNFSSFGSPCSTTSVLLLQIVQILDRSPNTCTVHISMLYLFLFHSPCLLYISSPFLETLSTL